MKSKGLKTAVFILCLVLAGTAMAAATPSVDDIYQAAKAGRLSDAQHMVEQVIAQHPNSAKAHFVAAEIYAREGKVAQARNELQTAQRLRPGLPFANPQSLQKLQTALAVPVPAHAASARSSFPLGSLVLLLVAGFILVMVIRALMSRNNSQTVYPAGQPYPPGGYGPGGMYPAPSGGLGSSILGGLATGAAVGAGMVAGEELAHHFLDGGNTQPAQQANVNGDMGGADFGITDAGSWDDSSNLADFSSGDLGGDDWS